MLDTYEWIYKLAQTINKNNPDIFACQWELWKSIETNKTTKKKISRDSTKNEIQLHSIFSLKCIIKICSVTGKTNNTVYHLHCNLLWIKLKKRNEQKKRKKRRMHSKLKKQMNGMLSVCPNHIELLLLVIKGNKRNERILLLRTVDNWNRKLNEIYS